MSKPFSRRMFMKAAAVAPVAAQEASAKIGIGAAGSSGKALANSSISQFHATSGSMTDDHLSWLKGKLKEVVGGEADDTRRRELKGYSIMLDPDLGSLRAVSPSFARATQIERMIDRHKQNEIDILKREIFQFSGGLK